jgi:hypothetical protein
MSYHRPLASVLVPAVAAVVASATLLAAPAAAQDPLIYGLNDSGKLSVNGTVLDSLPTSFDADAPSQNSFQRWVQLVVRDDLVSGLAQRYALRLDGTLYKNGESLYKLPFVQVGNGFPAWVGLSVSPNVVNAVRQDGVVNRNGIAVVTLPPGNFFFTACLGVEDDIDPDTDDEVYTLRSDGTVFRNLSTTPFLKFTGGPGIDVDDDGTGPDTGSNTATEGVGSETLWVALAVHPITGELWGLRVDGILSTGLSPTPPDPLPGDGEPPVEEVFELPFPTQFASVNTNDDRYRRIAFTGEGTWHVVRGDGAIFTDDSLEEPLVDLPSDADADETINDTYLDIATSGTDFWTIRWDGELYKSLSTCPLNLTSERYSNIEVSLLSPDLTTFKNPKPTAEVITVTVFEGESVSIPVVVSDIEKSADELSVQLLDPLKKPLPPGLDFDPVTRLIEWDSAGPKGSYTVPIVVSDGVNKPKTFNFKIKVKVPDFDPLKNKPPVFTKVKSTQAFVGHEYELRVFVADPDLGDSSTLALSVDTSKEPFATGGAVFHTNVEDPDNPGVIIPASEGVFRWTPSFCDIGKAKVKFTVIDAALKKKTYTVTIKVAFPLN